MYRLTCSILLILQNILAASQACPNIIPAFYTCILLCILIPRWRGEAWRSRRQCARRKHGGRVEDTTILWTFCIYLFCSFKIIIPTTKCFLLKSSIQLTSAKFMASTKNTTCHPISTSDKIVCMLQAWVSKMVGYLLWKPVAIQIFSGDFWSDHSPNKPLGGSNFKKNVRFMLMCTSITVENRGGNKVKC